MKELTLLGTPKVISGEKVIKTISSDRIAMVYQSDVGEIGIQTLQINRVTGQITENGTPETITTLAELSTITDMVSIEVINELYFVVFFANSDSLKGQTFSVDGVTGQVTKLGSEQIIYSETTISVASIHIEGNLFQVCWGRKYPEYARYSRIFDISVIDGSITPVNSLFTISNVVNNSYYPLSLAKINNTKIIIGYGQANAPTYKKLVRVLDIDPIDYEISFAGAEYAYSEGSTDVTSIDVNLFDYISGDRYISAYVRDYRQLIKLDESDWSFVNVGTPTAITDTYYITNNFSNITVGENQFLNNKKGLSLFEFDLSNGNLTKLQYLGEANAGGIYTNIIDLTGGVYISSWKFYTVDYLQVFTFLETPVDSDDVGLRRAQMRGTMAHLAIANPTVTDDKFQGFGEGDEWYNTATKNTFICLDATVGASVWEQKPGGGGIPEAPENGNIFGRKDAAWEEINFGVDSVNGQNGVVVLDKTDIGLSDVDNTSDLDKPVSDDTQTALNLKADISSLATVATTGQYNDLIGKPTIPTIPVDSVNGKTGVVVLNKTDIGLSNVDNTSDADKPISSATQTALNLKANSADLATVATTGDYDDLSNRPVLSTVATTGDYSDLVGKPTLGTMASQNSGDYIEITQKGSNNGVATLNASGKVPASQLDITSSVVSVNTKTGVVVLDKTDIGLSNVDNTSDALKPISTATQSALDLKADDNTVVKLSSAQTIADVKTFSSSPIVPTPTTDYQSVTKKYVDDGNKLFTISLNFIDETVSTIKAPGNMKINSITKESGTPTIKVNGSAYTLGTSISQYDEIEVTATVDTLVILNSEKI